MKAKYTSGEGEIETKNLSERMVESLRNLPPRAAGYALIPIFCPRDEIDVETIKVSHALDPKGRLTSIKVEFGNDRLMDTIEANLAARLTRRITLGVDMDDPGDGTSAYDNVKTALEHFGIRITMHKCEE